MHITVSRSIPIDIPDLASRIPVAYHAASGSFGGNGKKNLQPRALTCSYCWACAVGGQGLRAGSAVRHVEQSTFDFRSGIIRAEIMGDDWPRAPFKAERGLSPTWPICCHAHE